VQRHAPRQLADEMERHAPGQFAPIEAGRHDPHTPAGNIQKFQISLFRKRGAGGFRLAQERGRR